MACTESECGSAAAAALLAVSALEMNPHANVALLNNLFAMTWSARKPDSSSITSFKSKSTWNNPSLRGGSLDRPVDGVVGGSWIMRADLRVPRPVCRKSRRVHSTDGNNNNNKGTEAAPLPSQNLEQLRASAVRRLSGQRKVLSVVWQFARVALS